MFVASFGWPIKLRVFQRSRKQILSYLRTRIISLSDLRRCLLSLRKENVKERVPGLDKYQNEENKPKDHRGGTPPEHPDSGQC